MPSINCRRVHTGGRPCLIPRGSKSPAGPTAYSSGPTGRPESGAALRCCDRRPGRTRPGRGRPRGDRLESAATWWSPRWATCTPKDRPHGWHGPVAESPGRLHRKPATLDVVVRDTAIRGSVGATLADAHTVMAMAASGLVRGCVEAEYPLGRSTRHWIGWPAASHDVWSSPPKPLEPPSGAMKRTGPAGESHSAFEGARRLSPLPRDTPRRLAESAIDTSRRASLVNHGQLLYPTGRWRPRAPGPCGPGSPVCRPVATRSHDNCVQAADRNAPQQAGDEPAGRDCRAE
jgi:hypothetical protein